MSKMLRFTESDLQRAVARNNRSAKAAQPDAPRNTTQALDAGNAPGISGKAAGSSPVATTGGNATTSRSKYRNKKTTIDGITFDSKAESARYVQLKAQELAGVISGLTLQPMYELAPSVVVGGRKRPALRYKADFRYVRCDSNALIVEDVKGVITEGFRIKRHLMMAVHGIEVILS